MPSAAAGKISAVVCSTGTLNSPEPMQASLLGSRPRTLQLYLSRSLASRQPLAQPTSSTLLGTEGPCPRCISEIGVELTEPIVVALKPGVAFGLEEDIGLSHCFSANSNLPKASIKPEISRSFSSICAKTAAVSSGASVDRDLHDPSPREIVADPDLENLVDNVLLGSLHSPKQQAGNRRTVEQEVVQQLAFLLETAGQNDTQHRGVRSHAAGFQLAHGAAILAQQPIACGFPRLAT